MDNAFTLFQAMLLSLGYLMMGVPGATFIALIGGSLTAMLMAQLAHLTVGFAVLFGASIETLCSVFRVKNGKNDVKKMKMILAATISTTITAFLSYQMMVMFKFFPLDPTLGNSSLWRE